MKAAIVQEAGAVPVYGEFPEPTPAAGRVALKMQAAALSHLTRMRASGKHYSSQRALPFIPGVDGVGARADGKLFYTVLPEAPYGTMGEICSVDPTHCVELPEGIDAVSAAALGIPAMSSWAALTERAKLVKGETVLVNGATGTSGKLAVQIARHLGAAKVIATGRNKTVLLQLAELGADVCIPLVDDKDALEDSLKREFGQGVDIVLDYLWGASSQTLIAAAAKAAPDAVPVRFVSIGSIAGQEITLPAAALRASSLQLIGSGLGSVPFPRLIQVFGDVLRAAALKGFTVGARPVGLNEINSTWSAHGSERTVFVL